MRPKPSDGTGKIMEDKFMFDRLIESEAVHADLRNRKRYFLVSFFAVGTLFLSAVIFSIYAADFDIGNGELEITRLLAPIAHEAPEPPKPQEQRQETETRSATSQKPTRTDHIARIDEHQKVPTSISVERSSVKSRPYGDYTIDRIDFDPAGPPRTSNHSGNNREGNWSDRGISSETTQKPAERETEPPPPAAKRPAPIKSGGVINGNAISLPKPPYPRPAQMVGADGDVQVQVTIDEAGKVIYARAISGHPLLRNVAVNAARSARFNPTRLSDQPVKVTGIIVYKFTRP